MEKNYYVILGISSEASLEEIRAAFRRRALELHPDRSGLESGPFLEVQEAYGVLSDPERRRRYDLQRSPIVLRQRPWGPAPEPLVRSRPRGESFRPVESAHAIRRISLEQSFARYKPSFDELFDRLWSNFGSISRPKAERLESLTVEVTLTPEEARFGGRLQVAIPGRATCPACGGRGAVELYECWRCDGHGALSTDYPVDIDYPPGVQDGYAMRIPMGLFGIENFYLTVLYRVRSGA